MSNFLSKKYKDLLPYVPGEQPKERQYVKLNTNESPFLPSRLARKLVKSESKKLMLYSDPDLKDLTALLAKEYGVSPKNVIVSNGSDEVLNFAFMAYCDKDTPAIFPDITYGFYEVFAQINNVPFIKIPLKEDFSVAVEDYFNVNGTVFIANPNAPTGILLPLEKIEELLKSNPNRIVVIDEAYVDFGGESAVPLTKKYKNLIVTQTFSKSRSMAGARLGFAIADEGVITDLVSMKYSTNPYNVNRMTAVAGIGALTDKKYFENNCQKIINNRFFTETELKKLAFTMTNSKANFIFAKHSDISGKELYEKLKEQGVLVRYFNKPRISDYIRVTIGDKKQMQAFIDAVKFILEK